MFKYLVASMEDLLPIESRMLGDYGTQADAGYADPGLQKDKKPRYPLKIKGKYNEGHIRAAWNYIHKVKNRKPYTARQLALIENRIISGWKRAIDKKGPPSVATTEE